MFGHRKQAARDRDIAAYIQALRRHNGGGVGAAEAARLSRQDGRDYQETEVARAMSDMGRGQL